MTPSKIAPSGRSSAVSSPSERQHALDIGHEYRGRPDEQHAGALEPAPVAVEQVRRPVQRHRGLAGARAALDERHPARRRPDGLVLLLLDRGHDVAHAVALGPGQRGQQRAVADHRHRVRGVDVEQVVLDVEHLGSAAPDDPAAHHVHRLLGGGLVERGGPGGPPVDDQRVVLDVAQPQPSDVAGLDSSACRAGRRRDPRTRRPGPAAGGPRGRPWRRARPASRACGRGPSSGLPGGCVPPRPAWPPPARTRGRRGSVRRRSPPDGSPRTRSSFS